MEPDRTNCLVKDGPTGVKSNTESGRVYLASTTLGAISTPVIHTDNIALA